MPHDLSPDDRAEIARRRAARAARAAGAALRDARSQQTIGTAVRQPRLQDLAEPRAAPHTPSSRVLVGRNDWLFLCNDSNDVIGQHTGRVRLAPAVLENWSALTSARLELMERRGISWLCAIVPDKEAIYSEFLPPEIVLAERRPVHALLDIAADLDAPFLYLHDALQAAKAKMPLYPITGTHWNHLGAYTGYRAICSQYQKAGVELPVLSHDSIEWQQYQVADDLGRKLEPKQFGASVLAKVANQRARMVFDNRIMNRGRTVIFEREDGEGPRGVVFADSFAPYLLLFLKESFCRLVFVHTHAMPEEILEREKPDCVLSLTAERFIVRVPADATAMWQIHETVRSRRDRGEMVENVQWVYHSIPGAAEVRNDGELPWPSDDSS